MSADDIRDARHKKLEDQALVDFNRRKYDNARYSLEQLLDDKPEWKWAQDLHNVACARLQKSRSQKARAAYEKGEYEQARILFEYLTEKYTYWTWAHDLLEKTYYNLAGERSDQAYAEIEACEYEAARATLEKIVNDYPKWAWAVRGLARIYVELRLYDLALDTAKGCLLVNPNDKPAMTQMARAYGGQERWGQCLEAANSVLSKYPDYWYVRYFRALSYFNLNSCENALADLDVYISHEPNFIRALDYKALCLRKLRRYSEARDIMLSVLEQRPKYTWAHWLLGVIYLALEQYQDAISISEKCLEIEPEYEHAPWVIKCARAKLIYQVEISEEQQIELLKDSNHWNALGYLGRTYIKIGDYEQALAEFEFVLSKNPNDSPAYEDKLKSLFALKRNSEILEILEPKVKDQSAEDWEYHYLACTFHDMKRYEEALIYDHACLDRFPDDSKSKSYAARTLYCLKRYVESIDLADKLLLGDAKKLDVRVTKAMCFFELKKFQDGLNECELVLKQSPTSPSALEYKMLCLWGLHRFNEAIEIFHLLYSPFSDDASRLALLSDLTYGRARMMKGKVSQISQIPEILEEALQYATRAYELEPENENVVRKHSNALSRLCNIREAIEVCEKYMATHSAGAELHRWLGHAYMLQFKLSKARTEFQASYDLDPSHKKTRMALKFLYITSGQFRKARSITNPKS